MRNRILNSQLNKLYQEYNIKLRYLMKIFLIIEVIIEEFYDSMDAL